MGRITVDLLRKRSEHNERCISNLEELALHQQHIEKIELLNQACRHLKILLLQNNLIPKLENLHRMKQLQYLNVALNNISKIQNLQSCESLQKLDMTMNFVPKAGLLSVSSLDANHHFEELYLLGNPCSDWPGYRDYVIGALPRLQRLDGHPVKPSDRIIAGQKWQDLHQSLCGELRAQGIDVESWQTVEDDSLEYNSDDEVVDLGYIDPADGTFKRPWCAATRILEHRENEKIEREQEAKRTGQQQAFGRENKQRPRMTELPPIEDTSKLTQRNEGEWDFTIDESEDGGSIELEVAVPRHLDTALVQADVQPRWVRMLLKGRLLQLKLPCEVCPNLAQAQRSKASGRLVLSLPRANPDAALDITAMRPKAKGAGAEAGKLSKQAIQGMHHTTTSRSHTLQVDGSVALKQMVKAPIAECGDCCDSPPPL